MMKKILLFVCVSLWVLLACEKEPGEESKNEVFDTLKVYSIDTILVKRDSMVYDTTFIVRDSLIIIKVNDTTYVTVFDTVVNESGPLLKTGITGNVQKGPFLNGTAIVLYELDNNLNQTGRSFNTQISDNSGLFELKNIEFESQYVEIKATGYFFNEVLGSNSKSNITLYALADIKDSTLINVNILSTLERSRAKYLIDQGSSFYDAKKQAQTEILSAIHLSMDTYASSEFLDISNAGEGNEILLTLSALFQGLRTEAELSEFIANFNTDFRADGKLDSEIIGNSLVTHAAYLKPVEVQRNLENRYRDINVMANIPDFSQKFSTFLDNTKFEVGSLVEYPEKGSDGYNILNDSMEVYNSTTSKNSIVANIYAINPKSIDLRLEIEFEKYCIRDSVFHADTFSHVNELCNHFGTMTFQSGWEIETNEWYNNNTVQRLVFVSDKTKSIHNLRMTLKGEGAGSFKLYENDRLVRQKSFTWDFDY